MNHSANISEHPVGSFIKLCSKSVVNDLPCAPVKLLIFNLDKAHSNVLLCNSFNVGAFPVCNHFTEQFDWFSLLQAWQNLEQFVTAIEAARSPRTAGSVRLSPSLTSSVMCKYFYHSPRAGTRVSAFAITHKLKYIHNLIRHCFAGILKVTNGANHYLRIHIKTLLCLTRFSGSDCRMMTTRSASATREPEAASTTSWRPPSTTRPTPGHGLTAAAPR